MSKVYKIVVKEEYIIEAKSPKEAKAKFATVDTPAADKGVRFVQQDESKPELLGELK